jgi:hypothetical protein
MGQVALIDLGSAEEMSQYNWRASYCKCINGYYAISKLGYMHRYLRGNPDSHVDHKNGNSLDNRIDNLRLATFSENQGNSRKQKNNKSGFKGVSFVRAVQKWEARIHVRGRQIRIGRFLSPEEAHAAYCAEAKKQFGEYARIN